jgi:hypothetical protein
MTGIGRRKRQSRLAGQHGGRPKKPVSPVLQDNIMSLNPEITSEQTMLPGQLLSKLGIL